MTITHDTPTRTPIVTPPPLAFLELELTSRCQLTCGSLCYAEAGPTKGHGAMTADDWHRIIDEARDLGVKTVQFIGGEATMHPDFMPLVRHALDNGLWVRVYSNLYRIRAEHWALFDHRRVTLATSYHSVDAEEHDAITGRAGSHDSTRANIIEALRRGIPVKVGVIHTRDGQRSQEAVAEMRELGVTQVSMDTVRAVGNAAADKTLLPSTSVLCGQCANRKAAILPDGRVAPCGLGRFLATGNVKTRPLADVLASREWAQVAASIPRPKRGRNGSAPHAVADGCLPDEDSCGPAPVAPDLRAGCLPDEDSCGPAPVAPDLGGGCLPDEDSCMPAPRRQMALAQGCNPDNDSSDCSPAETPACEPAY
ncbi:radical SAM protein [Streptomyces sp. NPDC051643]|uniref:radical SAM protein n=1 Tax=Streptomyces sp. NPDC051643 TaxID=3365665 RepID=UPI00379ABEBA